MIRRYAEAGMMFPTSSESGEGEWVKYEDHMKEMADCLADYDSAVDSLAIAIDDVDTLRRELAELKGKVK